MAKSPFAALSPKNLISKAFELLNVGDAERDLQGIQDTIFGTTYGQERLNQQAFDFNAAQAQLNRDWQFQMMQYQNAYNSPSAMMQRFRDAGLNPAFMMSGSAPAIGSASLSGGSAASASSGSALHGNLSLSDALLGAQARLMESQASKFDVESKVMKDKLPKELSLMDETIKQVQSNTSLNNQLVDQSKAYTKVLGEEFQQKFIENEFLSATFQDRLAIVAAEKTIKATDAAYIRDNIIAQLNNLRESTKLMRSNSILNAQMGAHYAMIDRHLSYANYQMEAMTEYIKKKGDNISTENIMGFINAGAGAVRAVDGVVGTILSRGQKPNINISSGSNPGKGIHPNYGFE